MKQEDEHRLVQDIEPVFSSQSSQLDNLFLTALHSGMLYDTDSDMQRLIFTLFPRPHPFRLENRVRNSKERRNGAEECSSG